MKKRFDELGIEIPFPHHTLYFGVDRQGNAPPAPVRLINDERPTPDPA
jgi:small conductance mechanosensitive channel